MKYMSSGIPQVIERDIAERLDTEIRSFSRLGGGCINHGGRLTTLRGEFFLKWNDAKSLPGMFEAEAKGLSLLRNVGSIRIPNVHEMGEVGEFQYLLLEFIVEGRRTQTYWKHFAEGLASIHKEPHSHSGLDHDNYIGSLPQKNKQLPSWIDFFVEYRLQPLVSQAVDNRALEVGEARFFEDLYRKLNDIIPEEPMSLLHGDLWSGNLMTDEQGLPCLIDPAVYYGHREVDIAMTRLFGGFDGRWLEYYNKCYPLAPGYEERLDLYNLYPLLVHVNLFGAGYRNQLLALLRRFL